MSNSERATERRTPTGCPHCDHDGAFDGLGMFTRETSTRRFDGSGKVDNWEKWYRVRCPDCGGHFAMLEKTVERHYDETDVVHDEVPAR